MIQVPVIVHGVTVQRRTPHPAATALSVTCLLERYPRARPHAASHPIAFWRPGHPSIEQRPALVRAGRAHMCSRLSRRSYSGPFSITRRTGIRFYSY
jgi:hypothetical protein